MDRIRNPFVPGAGSRPPELAGRTGVLEDIDILLQRMLIGRATQSVILTGLRGVGKTVLLNEAERLAETHRYHASFVEAREGKRLPNLLVPTLRRTLHKLSLAEAAKEQSRRALRVFKSFVGAANLTFAGVELSFDPEPGAADSGDLEQDLPDLFVAIGEAAKASDVGVCVLIDELQYLSEAEFSALIMSVHRTTQKQLPVVLIGAGLPQILGLAGNSKSYAERLFRYPMVGALSPNDVEAALRGPARSEGADFSDDALSEVIRVTRGYPYFLQQWAYESWIVGAGPVLAKEDIVEATPIALQALDESFFKVRLDRCTPAEKRYMRALAELGEGTHRSGEVARVLQQ